MDETIFSNQEQQKIAFLHCLKEAMVDLNISQCALLLEEMGDGWKLFIYSIDEKKEGLEQKNTQLLTALNNFKTPEFIGDVLAHNFVLKYPGKWFKLKFTFSLSENFLGLDFKDWDNDNNLVEKMEKMYLASKVEEITLTKKLNKI